MKTKEDLQAMSHGELVEYALEAQNNIIIACDYQRKCIRLEDPSLRIQIRYWQHKRYTHKAFRPIHGNQDC